MRQILTEKEMYKLCDSFRLCSRIKEVYVDSKEDVEYANKVLGNLIVKGLAPPIPESHLIPGIKKAELKKQTIFSRLISGLKGYEMKEDVLTLYEYVTLFPSPKYKDVCDQKLFGPMTSAITHCFDSNYYAFQIRGKKMIAGAKIQIAAAGFGIYGEELPETAMRELKEEMGDEIKNARMVLPRDRCLDLVPFLFHNSTGYYPQPLASYIVTADLENLQKVESIEQIKELVADIKTGEVSDKFAVPLDNLEKISKEIENEIGFYGDMRRSIKSFLRWLYHN